MVVTQKVKTASRRAAGKNNKHSAKQRGVAHLVPVTRRAHLQQRNSAEKVKSYE